MRATLFFFITSCDNSLRGSRALGGRKDGDAFRIGQYFPCSGVPVTGKDFSQVNDCWAMQFEMYILVGILDPWGCHKMAIINIKSAKKGTATVNNCNLTMIAQVDMN